MLRMFMLCASLWMVSISVSWADEKKGPPTTEAIQKQLRGVWEAPVQKTDQKVVRTQMEFKGDDTILFVVRTDRTKPLGFSISESSLPYRLEQRDGVHRLIIIDAFYRDEKGIRTYFGEKKAVKPGDKELTSVVEFQLEGDNLVLKGTRRAGLLLDRKEELPKTWQRVKEKKE